MATFIIQNIYLYSCNLSVLKNIDFGKKKKKKNFFSS